MDINRNAGPMAVGTGAVLSKALTPSEYRNPAFNAKEFAAEVIAARFGISRGLARVVCELADIGGTLMRARRLPDIGGGAQRAPGAFPVAGKGYREEADDYRAVVARLNGGWRVIECRDGIQWILQRMAGKRHGQPRWDGRSYCRTRRALLRSVRDHCGVDAASIAIVENLPDWIGGRP